MGCPPSLSSRICVILSRSIRYLQSVDTVVDLHQTLLIKALVGSLIRQRLVYWYRFQQWSERSILTICKIVQIHFHEGLSVSVSQKFIPNFVQSRVPYRTSFHYNFVHLHYNFVLILITLQFRPAPLPEESKPSINGFSHWASWHFAVPLPRYGSKSINYPHQLP